MKKYYTNYDYCKNHYFAIDTAEQIIESLNNGEYEDVEIAIFEEVNRTLIYYEEQWKLLQTYQTPQEADYNKAIEMFLEELYSIIHEEELEEELDEEMDEER